LIVVMTKITSEGFTWGEGERKVSLSHYFHEALFSTRTICNNFAIEMFKF
jgi:hypothetical protein